MADANQPYGSRAATVLFFLAVELLLTLPNAAKAGAACNQVCSENTSNTFFGDIAGAQTTGAGNSAFGFGALFGRTSGDFNTAFGADSLASDTTGANNTANGSFSLEFNTTGGSNTATGTFVLFENTTGSNNTASGYEAMLANTTGYNNTANGMNALESNASGFDNTGDGYQALMHNTTGYYNTGLGQNALFHNTTGHANLAVGINAGLNLTTGSNNIVIGSLVGGVAGESNTIRIGLQNTQTATFIAGIAGSAVAGADVVVNSTGKLGIVASSARYKRDIKDMGATSDGVLKLRPVTFRYRNDERGVAQYGLVAEEVEKVYPELVTYGADGKLEAVRYSMLTSMLLNEVQKQARQIAQLEARHERELQEMRAAFEGRLSTIEQAMRTHDGNRTLATALDK